MFTKRITRNAAKELLQDNHTQVITPTAVDIPKEAEHKTKRFNDDYDDSSDEDDIDNKISEYDADDSWDKSLKIQMNQTKKTISNDKFLSFIAHAAGLKLLYSKLVNREYYPLKKKLLGETAALENASLQLHNLVKNTAIGVATASLEQLKTYILDTSQKEFSTNQINDAIRSISDEFSNEIEKIILKDNGKLIAHIFSIKYSTVNGESEYVKLFERQALDLLLSITAGKLNSRTIPIERILIKDRLLALANENIDIIATKLNLDSMDNASGKEKAILALNSYTGSYKHLADQVSATLKDCQARGHIRTMISKALENNKEQLKIIKSYLDDLRKLQSENLKQKKLSAREQEALKEYYTFSNDSIRDELSDSFSGHFHSKVTRAFKSFCRPSLGKSHLFISNNPSTFYANIRLSNRSQKRQTANLRNSLFAQDSVARMWRLSEKLRSDSDVVEMQDILGTSFGRRDFVIGVGNYKKIYDSISQLKEYLSDHNIESTDSDIAGWIRLIFKGSQPELHLHHADKIGILHKLQSIAYLLFGCEVTRNPAMSVVNQMLIDLIIRDPEWTFKEAFTQSAESGNKIMPMAPEGAVAAARSLEDSYRTYMPYPYHYLGVEDKDGNDGKLTEQELAKFEARIVREWLNQCVTPPVKMPGNHNAQWLLNLVESHFNEWLAPAIRELPANSKTTTSMNTKKNI